MHRVSSQLIGFITVPLFHFTNIPSEHKLAAQEWHTSRLRNDPLFICAILASSGPLSVRMLVSLSPVWSPWMSLTITYLCPLWTSQLSPPWQASAWAREMSDTWGQVTCCTCRGHSDKYLKAWPINDLLMTLQGCDHSDVELHGSAWDPGPGEPGQVWEAEVTEHHW